MHQKKIDKNLKKDICKYITDLFNKNLPSWAVYHNLSHTIETVYASEEIGRGSGLSEEDLEILYIAAWFHDIGYIYQANEHEEKSSKIASEFLNTKKYPKEKINKVIGCIMATKVSNKPNNLLESVICDADLFSLGISDYIKQNNLLKTEIERKENRIISELEWNKRSLNFLLSHKYYTEYARRTYGSQIKMNIRNLEKMLKRK